MCFVRDSTRERCASDNWFSHLIWCSQDHLGSMHRVTQNRSFDTEQATSSYATGFVVDDVRGIIVTNRHVVTPGAWRAAHPFTIVCWT